MTMGKGGVGKTTVASAIAIELAARGHSGTSQHHGPRGSPGGNGRGSVPNLTVSRIDPASRDRRVHRSRSGESGARTGRARDGAA